MEHQDSRTGKFPNVHTRTFLMTDLEGSTKKWSNHREAMSAALRNHDAILSKSITKFGGTLFKHTGDGICAVFDNPVSAINAARDAQLAMIQVNWSELGELKFRAGIHTGSAEARDGDWYGEAMNQVGRLHAAGHGGQTLISETTWALVHHEVDLIDLGSYRLKDLSHPVSVFQLSLPNIDQDFPPLRSVETTANNLPHYIDKFIGRSVEIAEVVAALEKSRLVTITGVGGAGKTRLSIEAVAHLIHHFKDGIWLCELASVSLEDSVPNVIANVIGVVQQSGKTINESIIDSLKHRELLIVLDNCEHVLDVIAKMVLAIMARCPKTKILVTSRESLAVQGEYIIRLKSLSTIEGAQLFRDRAFTVGARGSLSENTLEELSERLDGMPLAIEIAAARCTTMSPEEIKNGLNDRFRLLRGSGRGRQERHQTLRNTVAWSYDLLGGREQHVFIELSVFNGSFNLKSAGYIVGGDQIDLLDVEDILLKLVQCSMVVASENEDGTRFRLLETLRLYGEEKLLLRGDTEALHDRYITWFAEFMDQAWTGIWSNEDAFWIRAIGLEYENLRMAVYNAVDHSYSEMVQKLIKPLSWWAWGALRYEVADWALAALTISPEPKYARAVAGILLSLGGRFDETEKLVESITHPEMNPDTDEANLQSQALFIVATILRPLEVENYMRRLVASALKTNNAALINTWKSIEVPFAVMAGRMEEARKIAEGTMESAKRMTNQTALCWCHFAHGRALSDSKPEQALIAFDRSIDIAQRIDNQLVGAIAATEAAAIIAKIRDPEEGRVRLSTAIRSFIISGDHQQLWTSVHHLVFFLIRLEKMDAAKLLWEGLVNRTGYAALHHRETLFELFGDGVKNSLSDDDFIKLISAALDDLEK